MRANRILRTAFACLGHNPLRTVLTLLLASLSESEPLSPC